MKEIAISKFKATCLAVLEQIRQTGVPVRVTKFGEPVAEIGPPTVPTTKEWFGSMAGTASLHDDLIEPAGSPDDWEVLA